MPESLGGIDFVLNDVEIVAVLPHMERRLFFAQDCSNVINDTPVHNSKDLVK